MLSVFALVTLLSYGVLPQDELGGVGQPSMAVGAGIHRRALGIDLHPRGRRVSVLGAYLAWTLMAAEVLYIPANTDDMPRFLARTNRKDAPVAALVMAARSDLAVARPLLFAADALDFMLDLTAALSLIPYLLAAAYALKLTVTRETYGDGKSLGARHGDRRRSNGVHAVSDLRRRPGQASAVMHLVRAGRRVCTSRPVANGDLRVFTPPRRCCSA